MPSGPLPATELGPNQRALSVAITLGCSTFLLLSLSGCGRLKQQVKESIDNNPQMRQSAIDNARSSCIQTATAKAPKLPGLDVKIHTYCDCFATKGLAQFSNSELTSIAIHSGHFTPEQQTKLMQGVLLCQGELGGRRH